MAVSKIPYPNQELTYVPIDIEAHVQDGTGSVVKETIVDISGYCPPGKTLLGAYGLRLNSYMLPYVSNNDVKTYVNMISTSAIRIQNFATGWESYHLYGILAYK